MEEAGGFRSKANSSVCNPLPPSPPIQKSLSPEGGGGGCGRAEGREVVSY